MIALNERQLPREFEVIATFARDQADHIDGRAVLDRHPFGLAAYIDQRMLQMQGRDLATQAFLTLLIAAKIRAWSSSAK